jgi:predicted RND superfamily exporter protein
VLLGASLKALRALGFTAGIGVVMALISMLTVLPALLALYDKHRKSDSELVPHVHFVLLERLAPVLVSWRYAVLAIFLIASITLGYFAPSIELERDPWKLQPVGMPANLLQQRILEEFSISGEPSIFFAKDLKEAQEIYERATKARTVAEPISVTMLLPSQQAAKAPLIDVMAEKLAAIRPDGERPAHTYDDDAVAELRLRMARLKSTVLQLSALTAALYDEETQAQVGRLRDEINRIDRRLIPVTGANIAYLDRLLTAELDGLLGVFDSMTKNTSLSVDDLPSSVVDRLRGDDGTWMVLVRAKEYVFAPEFLSAHLAELEAIHPEMTGLTAAGARMLEKILFDVPLLTLLTAIAVALMVLIGLRSVKSTLLALTPMVLGMLWTIGLLAAFGVPFNFVSILAIPLIVGIGIDDGVHLYHRIRHERSLGKALAHSGKPIILTSLTTGIGFGSLLLSVHRGVFFLGFTTVIGIAVCLIISLFLMPALVAIFDEETVPGDIAAADGRVVTTAATAGPAETSTDEVSLEAAEQADATQEGEDKPEPEESAGDADPDAADDDEEERA